jgi:hypothetical protein
MSSVSRHQLPAVKGKKRGGVSSPMLATLLTRLPSQVISRHNSLTLLLAGVNGPRALLRRDGLLRVLHQVVRDGDR